MWCLKAWALEKVKLVNVLNILSSSSLSLRTVTYALSEPVRICKTISVKIPFNTGFDPQNTRLRLNDKHTNRVIGN